METILKNPTKNNQTGVSNELAVIEDLKNLTVSHALVTNVEFESGKKSSVITLFNNADLSFEEMKIGVTTSLKRQSYLGIKKEKTTFYSLKNGVLNYCTEFL